MSPDNRKHRGPGPKDYQLFHENQIAILKMAASDYCRLLDRGYTEKASLKLIGDHFKLQERQRQALDKCCQPLTLVKTISEQQLFSIKPNEEIIIDGFNLLIILEAALSGAPLFRGRDGLFRDISGLHGSYHKIEETPQAISLVADWFKISEVSSATWIFDKPVSNSGRLAKLVKEQGLQVGIKWETQLKDRADSFLANNGAIVISSDSQILARCNRWFNLLEHILTHNIKEKWIIDLYEKNRKNQDYSDLSAS